MGIGFSGQFIPIAGIAVFDTARFVDSIACKSPGTHRKLRDQVILVDDIEDALVSVSGGIGISRGAGRGKGIGKHAIAGIDPFGSHKIGQGAAGAALLVRMISAGNCRYVGLV